jgi:hypothetical protein
VEWPSLRSWCDPSRRKHWRILEAESNQKLRAEACLRGSAPWPFFPSDSDASGSRTLIGYTPSQPRIPRAIYLAHAASTEGCTDLDLMLRTFIL